MPVRLRGFGCDVRDQHQRDGEKAGEVRDITDRIKAEDASFRLDREGRNVIVIMMDRAIGSFVPYLMNEKPELKEQFDGFTYYPNSLSYGYHTNIASPALYGDMSIPRTAWRNGRSFP